MDEPVPLRLGSHPCNSATFEKRERQLREDGNSFADVGTSWHELLLKTKEKCEKIMQDNAEHEEELRRRFG